MALVYALDNSEYLSQPGLFEEETATVFFDILGIFAFRCRFPVGQTRFHSKERILFPACAINIAVLAWVVASLLQDRNPYFIKAFAISLFLTVVPFTFLLVASSRLLGFQFFW